MRRTYRLEPNPHLRNCATSFPYFRCAICRSSHFK